MSHPSIEYIRKFVNSNNPKEEYDIKNEIGSGTYGYVYKAIHRKTGKCVAIKIMKIDLKDDVVAICQEIDTLRECRHANIVQFFGSYLESTKLWICMEFCGGQSLQDIYLNLRRAIEEDCIAFISRDTLRGLDYMHKKGHIHRDIKGANILLTDSGEVKIADFGIAAKLSATVAKRMTLIGTPYWMAPEVASVNNNNSGYNERCDVWAVAITAIEYAELQPPMFDLHPMKALQILSQKGYVPPKLQQKDQWSPKFHSFLSYALQKNEQKRPSCEVILMHEFVTQPHLSEHLTQHLLMMNNKGHKFPVFINTTPFPEEKIPQTDRAVVCEPNPPLIIENKYFKYITPKPALSGAIIGNHNISIKLNQDVFSKSNEFLPIFGADKGRVPSINIEGIMTSKPSSSMNPQKISKKKSRGSLGDLKIYPQVQYEARTDIYQKPARPKSMANIYLGDGGIKPPLSGKSSQSLDDLKKIDSFEDFNPFSIPRIPKVHMGACFVLMFEECPLKINCSASWVNPETNVQLLLLGTNDGIFFLNTNEIHERQLERLVTRRCIWLCVIRDTLMSLSGRGPHLYSHNLVSLIRLKSSDAVIGKLTKNLIPRRLRPSCKLADTSGCQMASIVRNPFTGAKYMCAAVNKQIFLYEWSSAHSTFIEIKRVDVAIMPCPLLNFDLIVTREQSFPMVCLGVYKTSEAERYKLNLINLLDNNRTVWFHPMNNAEDRLNVIKVIQIELNTILVCFPDRGIFLGLSGRVKSNQAKVFSLQYGRNIESVVCLRDSVLAFHTRGLRGVDFSGQVTQNIYDEKHIYRLLGADTYAPFVLVETKPTENPMDNANVYMLVGHQDQ